MHNRRRRISCGASNAEIELEKQKAADGMRRRIADISVDVAEKLLARSVDGSEHRRLIDSAIDEDW